MVVAVDRREGPGYARSLRFSLEDFLTAPFLLSSFSTFSLWSSTFIMVSLASVTWSITSLQRCMLPWGQTRSHRWAENITHSRSSLVLPLCFHSEDNRQLLQGETRRLLSCACTAIGHCQWSWIMQLQQLLFNLHITVANKQDNKKTGPFCSCTK